MKPEQIKVGKSYRISGRGIVSSVVCEVEEIRDGKVIVNVKGRGRRVEANLKIFAGLVAEEVSA